MSDDQIADALRSTYGCVVAAARLLGVTARALYYRFEQNPDLKDVVHEAKEYLCDHAQLKLAELISQGNTAAVIFTLKTLGRERGFDENPQAPPPANVNVSIELQQALAMMMQDDQALEAARDLDPDSDAGNIGQGGEPGAEGPPVADGGDASPYRQGVDGHGPPPGPEPAAD